MIKMLCIIAIMLFTTITHCQKSTLLQNINIEARELEHSLNDTGDTLILQGERFIDKVEIFNVDFQKTFMVQNLKVTIPLTDIPVGRFVTEVKLRDKLIIITLLRHEVINESQDISNKSEPTEAKKAIIETENENIAQLEISNTSNGKLQNTNKPKNKISYWIIKRINNGHSSRKIVKFATKGEVNKIIEQHTLDLRTKSGRYNELTILEVYDIGKFLSYKRVNSDYAEKTTTIDCFNTLPYYESSKPISVL